MDIANCGEVCGGLESEVYPRDPLAWISKPGVFFGCPRHLLSVCAIRSAIYDFAPCMMWVLDEQKVSFFYSSHIFGFVCI